MRRVALRLGALDYISKISFDGDECDQILELVERKYKENQSEKRTAEGGFRTPEKAGKSVDEYQMDL